MKIREAEYIDFDALMTFYDIMCKYLGQMSFLPNGNKGGFPSREMVLDAIESKEQFVLEEDGQIVAAYIMNHKCDKAYENVEWQIEAKMSEIVTLHALRVLPEYGGKGYSKRLLEHAIKTARQRGQRAIRLDCLVGNEVPQKMYLSYGFSYIDTVEITYADIGEPRMFRLYEFVL